MTALLTVDDGALLKADGLESRGEIKVRVSNEKGKTVVVGIEK